MLEALRCPQCGSSLWEFSCAETSWVEGIIPVDMYESRIVNKTLAQETIEYGDNLTCGDCGNELTLAELRSQQNKKEVKKNG